MNLSLQGRRSLVCGSSQGIGLAAARELAELGSDVTLLARDPRRLDAAVAQLPCSGRQSHETLSADFASLDSLAAALETWIERHGGAEILINNTGGPPPGLALEAQPDDFIQAFSNHLLANQLLVQRLLPRMKSAGYGRIINVISTSVKQPIPGLGVSNTVRGAVANWAKTLALELAPYRITVNNVLPGATRTARLEQILADSATRANSTIAAAEQKMIAPIPLARFAEPQEIGAAIAFLASPAAAYITGINLPVDGGRTQCL